jgi:hypothetical protein
MDARAGLSATLLLNIQRKKGDTTAAEQLVRRFADRFWKTDWPGLARPSVYYDPRSLEPEGAAGVLHAKAVVVDDEAVFVTSANLTEAALDRKTLRRYLSYLATRRYAKRTVARKADVANIGVQGNYVRFGPLQLPESKQLRLQRLYPGTLVKGTVRTILVPRPMTAAVAGQPLRDTAVLRWASDLIRAVLLDSMADAARVASGSR